MMKSFLRLVGAGLLSVTLQVQALELRPDHPQQYQVRSGDTLWDISSRFLRDPWFWPELWQANPEIQNPHLIYPGDTLRLVYFDGRPGLSVERGGGERTLKFRPGDTVKLTPQARITPLDTVIPAIPLDHVRGFLVENRVLGLDELDEAPYVVAGDEEHIIMGGGDYLYVRGDWSEPHTAYGIYRQGVVYTDPDTNEFLGHGAEDVGVARYENHSDSVARFKLQSSNRDVRIGDRLLPTEERQINSTFHPKSPDIEVDGKIIHVFGGVRNVSQYNVVVLNRGEREGLAVGDVLAIYSQGEVVKDRVTNELIKIPDHRRGILMVFRTFEKVSYGLILRSSAPLKIGDSVKNP